MRLMQVRAVVELAVVGVGGNVGHETGQLHGFYVVQTKLLEAR